MDVAFVKNAEDQIDDEQRRRDEQRDCRQRLLKGLGVALEGRLQRSRNMKFTFGGVDRFGCRTERAARREIETDRYGRKLALVADRQWLGLARRPTCEGRHRNKTASCRRTDINPVEALRVALNFGQRLHNHVIAVLLREILRNLPLPECVVQRIVNHLGSEPISRRLVAIDVDG